MTDAELKSHLSRRKNRALHFVRHPELFKVCDQCLSISRVATRVCAVCGAYRWDESAERVIAVSSVMARNPFPLTAGVVPRLAAEGG